MNFNKEVNGFLHLLVIFKNFLRVGQVFSGMIFLMLSNNFFLLLAQDKRLEFILQILIGVLAVDEDEKSEMEVIKFSDDVVWNALPL